VEYAVPNIIKEREESGIHFDSGSETNGIEKTVVSKTSESFYDLLGRRMDSPAGLTIVVTRYSDGTVRTEKKLFND
jgi:hypothetical protein